MSLFVSDSCLSPCLQHLFIWAVSRQTTLCHLTETSIKVFDGLGGGRTDVAREGNGESVKE